MIQKGSDRMTLKTVLAFGDSNTFGLNPISRGGAYIRFDSRTRWTGRLAEMLSGLDTDFI